MLSLSLNTTYIREEAEAIEYMDDIFGPVKLEVPTCSDDTASTVFSPAYFSP
jgi:hypothetical protein